MIFSSDIFGRSRPRYASKEEPEQLLRLANTVWRTMLLLVFGVLVSTVLFGAYLFTSSNSVVSEVAKGGARQQQLLNTAQLSSIVSNIQTRESIFESLKAGTSTAADPSR